MCDYHEIANLVYEYGYRIDAGDFEGVGQLLGDARLIYDGLDVCFVPFLSGQYKRRCEWDRGCRESGI